MSSSSFYLTKADLVGNTNTFQGGGECLADEETSIASPILTTFLHFILPRLSLMIVLLESMLLKLSQILLLFRVFLNFMLCDASIALRECLID